MELYGNTQKEEVVSHEMLYFLYIQKVTLHQTELPKRNYIKMILLKKPIFFSQKQLNKINIQNNNIQTLKVATREEELKPMPANYPHGHCWAGFILASNFPHKLSAKLGARIHSPL